MEGSPTIEPYSRHLADTPRNAERRDAPFFLAIQRPPTANPWSEPTIDWAVTDFNRLGRGRDGIFSL
jgi:hypothetical protein